MKSVANDAKNKWDNFVLKANNSFDDASNFVSTEHSQIEDVFEHWLVVILLLCLNLFKKYFFIAVAISFFFDKYKTK